LIKQVVILAWNPAFALFADSATGNQAVEMKMGLEVLIPGMQKGHKSQFSPELVFTKFKKTLRDGFKEDVEHHGFVL
jgi:hypothetical protein